MCAKWEGFQKLLHQAQQGKIDAAGSSSGSSLPSTLFLLMTYLR
jgi:hypothetical protein